MRSLAAALDLLEEEEDGEEEEWLYLRSNARRWCGARSPWETAPRRQLAKPLGTCRDTQLGACLYIQSSLFTGFVAHSPGLHRVSLLPHPLVLVVLLLCWPTPPTLFPRAPQIQTALGETGLTLTGRHGPRQHSRVSIVNKPPLLHRLPPIRAQCLLPLSVYAQW